MIQTKKFIFRWIFLSIVFFSLFTGCKNSDYNGRYCANVQYHNPNTDTHSEYTLTVTVDDNQLTKIDFPQGYLSDNDLPSATFDGNGNTKFTTERGYEYTVNITGPETGCFDNISKSIQCSGITKKGVRCKKLTDNANGLCWSHRNQ
ncbi:MAG: hypothetical protein IPL20_14315 [Saprospiraceae bacterium]|nr:hypothetical protein [Saprospiraceae bacterium]